MAPTHTARVLSIMSKSEPDRWPNSSPPLSLASARRLTLYLRCLEALRREGCPIVSSGQVGEALGISDAQVRKDIACLGNLGQPGIGYSTSELITAIRRALGIDREWRAVVVGVGNLARALLRYHGFQQQGFRLVALCDNDAAKIGEVLEGLTIRPMEQLIEAVQETGAELGILTVPAEAAQFAADRLVAAGIRGILNFAPVVLRVPPPVSLVAVDLAAQLEQLAFLVQWSRDRDGTTR
jgi:redox-sensing transcriptional repressor